MCIFISINFASACDMWQRLHEVISLALTERELGLHLVPK
jgi:hypothetical protein